jgi:RNA polymerase sigma factor (sigma-70 family)
VEEPTDRELVILARQGNKEAFNHLIERYYRQAERVALRMVNAADTAQDLVQEALLQAYLSLDELQKEDSFRSWLYGIVMNISKSYLREQYQHRLDFELDEKHPVSANEDPQQVAMENELHRLVLATIEELPSTHRETALLYYYESLTLHEIASITHASKSAIKVRLHRTRNYLREKLRPAYPEIEPRPRKTFRRKVMVPARVVNIVKNEGKFVVILQEEGQETYLPIWIGPFESEAIALGLLAYPMRRPQTFDFIVHILEALETGLEEVRIEMLRDDVYYGVAKLRLGNEVKEVDARPSDILALAVRTGSPIYIATEIMQQKGVGSDVLEKELGLGPIHPDEGVESILTEFEEARKAYQVKMQAKEEEEAKEKKV